MQINMKSHEKIVLAALVIFAMTACSNSKPTNKTSTSESVISPSTNPQHESINLTPEERVNSGTHSYNIEAEIACNSVEGSSREKFTITFSDGTVEIHKIEPEDEPWSHLFTKVSKNTYIANYSEAQVNIEFRIDGFDMDSSGTFECGRYIRTLIP